MVLVGIHTPETEGEKKVDAIQKKMKEAGLTHRIAVDNDGAMWRRYNNRYWPTVYIFDKRGIACWGWQGELNWKGAKGDVKLRKKIEELLQEKLD